MKRSEEIGGKGYILLLVAKLINAVLYIGHIIVLRRVFYYFCYILLYFANSAIFYLL